MGKESCLLLPLLLFLLFSKTAQQDNVKQSTQIIVLLQNILEGEQSNGECFSYSNSFYLCTGSDDWEKGLAYFDDFVPSQGSITGITITANGDTSCSALTTSRKFTFYLNDENVGVWKASPVPFNCTLDHCDEPDQAPFVKMSQKNPFLRGQQNKIEMEDDEVIDNAGTGCYGSYNVSISYTGPASPSPSPFPVPPSPSPFPSPTPSPPPSPSPFPSPSPSPSPPNTFFETYFFWFGVVFGAVFCLLCSISLFYRCNLWIKGSNSGRTYSFDE